MRKKALIALGVAVVLVAGAALLLTQPVTTGARTGPEVKVDPASLKASVEKLSVKYSPRDSTHSGNLDDAAAWLRQELGHNAVEIRTQEWKVEGYGYWNVIASFGPLTPERVVVGAHYDGCGAFPAADDNGSGVAVLIELGKLLAEHPPKNRVELVAWSLEEPPYFRTESMGSFHHAKQLAESKVKVRAAISLESMGYFKDEEGTQKFPAPGLGLLYSTRASYLAVVGNLGQIGLTRQVKAAMKSASPLPVFSINAPVVIPGIDFSDHLNFWKFGYPAVMITDTAFNRNDNYHQKTDTFDTLDYPRLAQATEGVFEAVWQLSQ
jgi:hypothetical protein